MEEDVRRSRPRITPQDKLLAEISNKLENQTKMLTELQIKFVKQEKEMTELSRDIFKMTIIYITGVISVILQIVIPILK